MVTIEESRQADEDGHEWVSTKITLGISLQFLYSGDEYDLQENPIVMETLVKFGQHLAHDIADNLTKPIARTVMHALGVYAVKVHADGMNCEDAE